MNTPANPSSQSTVYLLALALALAPAAPAGITLGANDVFTPPATTPNGNLSITGNLSVGRSFGVGVSIADATKSGFQLDFYNTALLPKTTSFDLSDTAAGFIWRDSLATTAKNKMSLDASNTLNLYKADGTTVGLTFNPNTGITLADGTQLNGAASLRSTALYDAGGNVVASVADDGKVKFTNGITFGTDPNIKLNASNVAALQSTLNNLGYQENPVTATGIHKIAITNATVTSVVTVGSRSTGNLYMVGHFRGGASIGGRSVVSAGQQDGFVARLNSFGVVSWIKTIGGVLSDSATSVSVDSSGNVFVGGFFEGVTTNLGTANLTSAGSTDGYVAKFSPNGVVLWAKPIGGPDYDFATSTSVDGGGNVCVAGSFWSRTTTLGAANLTSAGNQDG